MLHINTFGRSFVVDKASNYILLTVRSNEVAKLVSSSILDTVTAQRADMLLNKFDQSIFQPPKWVKWITGGGIEIADTPSQDIIKKREIAHLRSRSFFILFEHLSHLKNYYDYASDLNSEDLNMYIMFKDKFIEKYAESKGTDTYTAKKHLDFLAQSLLEVQLRRYNLQWKFTEKIKKLETQEQLFSIRDELLAEVRYGKI